MYTGGVNVASLATSNFNEIYSKDIHSSMIVPITENSKFGMDTVYRIQFFV